MRHVPASGAVFLIINSNPWPFISQKAKLEKYKSRFEQAIDFVLPFMSLMLLCKSIARFCFLSLSLSLSLTHSLSFSLSLSPSSLKNFCFTLSRGLLVAYYVYVKPALSRSWLVELLNNTRINTRTRTRALRIYSSYLCETKFFFNNNFLLSTFQFKECQ